jgi:hypothetical protein
MRLRVEQAAGAVKRRPREAYRCPGHCDYGPSRRSLSAQVEGSPRFSRRVREKRLESPADALRFLIHPRQRGRSLVLAARVLPEYHACKAAGLDPVAWAKKGWIGFLTVSPYSGTQYDLPIKPWKDLIRNVPIYGCADSAGTAANYRLAAEHFLKNGADGIYLFNFFCPRESFVEPPFEGLKDLGGQTGHFRR